MTEGGFQRAIAPSPTFYTTWGVGGWAFLDPAHLGLMAFLLVVLLGISTAGVPALAAHLPSYVTFTSPLWALVSLRLFLDDQVFSNWIAMLGLAYLGASLFFARNLGNAITASITSDLENARLLDEVTLAKESAEEANRDKSRFLAAVSHDLRQPLHAMGLFLESLGGRLQSAEQKELYGNISNALHALEDMFSSLLEISRLDSGSVTPSITHFPLQSLLHKLATEFSTEVEHKALSLQVSDTPHIVRSDAVLLGRIFRNLLSNAVKYTDNGSIKIETVAENGAVKVQITDTGRGIPRRDRELIFSEYHQLENPERDRTKGLGLGLGLAVVKRTCALLDHPLSVDSEFRSGSTFTVTVATGDPRRVVQEPETHRRAELMGAHILVVDDEEGIRSGMRTLLGDWGCQVTVAGSEDEAKTLLADRSPPDLLICDYRLREGRSGLEAIDAIRTYTDPELPALLMSGDTQQSLHQQASARGLYLLHKPIKPAHLVKVMVELLYAP